MPSPNLDANVQKRGERRGRWEDDDWTKTGAKTVDQRGSVRAQDSPTNSRDDGRRHFAFGRASVPPQRFGYRQLFGSPLFARRASRQVRVNGRIFGGRELAVQEIDDLFDARMRLVHDETSCSA